MIKQISISTVSLLISSLLATGCGFSEDKTINDSYNTPDDVSGTTQTMKFPVEFIPVSTTPVKTINEPSGKYSTIAAAYSLKPVDETNFHLFGMVSDPSVIYDNGIYRMWFSAVQNIDQNGQTPPDRGSYNSVEDQLNLQGIAYSQSSDGISWSDSKNMNTNIDLQIEPGEGAWDKYGIETCTVVKNPETGKYFLYYAGKTTISVDGVEYHYFSGIGCATSTDGIKWQKETVPVITSEEQWEQPYYTSQWYKNAFAASNGNIHEAGGIIEPTVLYDKTEGLFKMWYAGMGETTKGDGTTWDVRMGYAVSADGIHWKKYGDYIFERGTSGEWDDSWASHYNVVKTSDSSYHLFYAGSSSSETIYAIGHAFSKDGFNWERNPDNPLLKNTAGSWHEKMTGGPSVILKDNSLHLWFFGSKLNNFTFVYFGYAKADFLH